MAETLHLYKIFYDDETRRQVAPPFLPLDNRGGPPDWFELSPILRFLSENTLDPDAWYGFLSPKFPDKAFTSVTEVQALIDAHPDAQVALFSPLWRQLVTERNVWTQGERWHPGLIAATEAFLDSQGERVDLRQEIGDFRTSVFSNYIVARPCFWQAWAVLARAYYDHVETGPDTLIDRQPVQHGSRAGYPLKVFVQERLACWVLRRDRFRVVHLDYARRPLGLGPYDDTTPLLGALLLVGDTLKRVARRRRVPGAMSAWRFVIRVVERLRVRRVVRRQRRATAMERGAALTTARTGRRGQ